MRSSATPNSRARVTRRDRAQVQSGFPAQAALEPGARGAGVGERFLRAEGLRRDDDERSGGLQARQSFGYRGAVYVGDEVRAQPAARAGLERLAHEARPEVRSPDAEID